MSYGLGTYTKIAEAMEEKKMKGKVNAGSTDCIVKRSVLEKSLEYLACPDEGSPLILDVPDSDDVSEGEYRCTSCGNVYKIRNGVPYFYENGNGFEWQGLSDNEIVECAKSSFDDWDSTWAKISALGTALFERTGDRKQSIDKVFRIVEELVKNNNTSGDKEAFLMQAATAARYDIEIYRGTFQLPKSILGYLDENYKQGIIAEGACADGQCLSQIAKRIDSDFYLGIDISGNLIRDAQRNVGENMLFVQGNICNLPLRSDSVGVYVLNNVFDRVGNPGLACAKADTVLQDYDSFFVLSNCDPLQYTYTASDESVITFVPRQKQLSLEQGLIKADFLKSAEDKGLWLVSSVAYDNEELPYRSIVGTRPSIEKQRCDLDFVKAVRLALETSQSIDPLIDASAGASSGMGIACGSDVRYQCFGPRVLCMECKNYGGNKK